MLNKLFFARISMIISILSFAFTSKENIWLVDLATGFFVLSVFLYVVYIKELRGNNQ